MSRVIKFRAWAHYGEMLPNVQNHIGNGPWAFGTMLTKPDEFSIMQFTGLTDKNGVEIYEGDIVCIEYKWMEHIEKGKPYPVEFSDCDVSVQWSVCDVPIIAFNFGGSLLATDENYEVIGNIYQNPELLQTT